MKTKLEEISAVKKKLIVEIESEEVDKKLDIAYKELGKQAKVPGFRPGKVPRRILEARFWSQVEEDVTKNLISDTFSEALEKLETIPLGTPLLERDALKPGQVFKYSAVMEVRPQFELKDYLGHEVKKETVSVTEKDVNQRLDQIREANGKLNSMQEDRSIRNDDYAVLEYEGFEAGKSLEGIKATNFLLKVGNGDFHPAFEESLIGLKKDAQKEIKVDFEDSYYHTKLAGKSVDFKVKVLDIRTMELPNLNDDFARNLGVEFKDLEDLKNKVRDSLVAQEEKRIDRQLRNSLLEKISESVDFELPEVLVESEIDYAVENVNQNLLRSGSNLTKAGISEEKIRQDFRPSAEKRVKEMFILGEIAKEKKIEVDEDDLSRSFKDLASATGQNTEDLRKFYEVRNLMGSLKEKLLEEKTLNYLIEHANIQEKKPASGGKEVKSGE